MAKIFPLSEGIFTIGWDKRFVPFNPDVQVLNERPVGSLLVEVQPFLVQTATDLIVLDTGLGFTDGQNVPQIHQTIAQAGFDYRAVTKVLLSHLHKDHAGGVVYMQDNGVAALTFPNAAYYVYRPEADFALKTGFPAYHPADIEALLTANQVHWLDGDAGQITNEISFRHSGGHSPQHIVFLIEAAGDKIFFGGDEAPQLKQLKMKYTAKYDFDGQKAMELRRQYAEEGRAAGWLFLFYHDVQTPMARL